MGLFDFLAELLGTSVSGRPRSADRVRSTDLNDEMIDDAAARRYSVSFDYEDMKGTRTRRSNVRITKTEDDHFLAFDRGAGGPRTFRRGKVKDVDRDD